MNQPRLASAQDTAAQPSPWPIWSTVRLPAALLLSAVLSTTAMAQPVAAPWGNVLGIQIDGERMDFETSLRMVKPDWSGFVQSSKYNWQGRQTFTVEDKIHTCAHFLQDTPLQYTTRITDTGRGLAEVDLQVGWEETAPMASAPPNRDVPPDSPARTGKLEMAGAFCCVNLPADAYVGATFELIDSDHQPLPTLTDFTGAMKELARGKARGFRVTGLNHTLEVIGDADTEILVRQDFVDQPAYLNDPRPRLNFVKQDAKLKIADYQVYFSVLPATVKKGASAHRHYRIKADGKIDRSPVNLTLDAARPGRAFAGVGGNYRMYQPALDAQVVDYLFENLNVTWGRVAFFWDEWQPKENDDPVARAKAGGLNARFLRQLEIARTLAQKRIPVIVSVWVPPDWAKDLGPLPPKGVRLNPAKLSQAADSIASYLIYLKQQTGLEATLFSFNETDYGVEVLQSPEEHALANKVIGSRLAEKGLITKMLLGDTGAGTEVAHRIVLPTQNDPTILPYLGGISFHTYHGTTESDLKVWAESARVLNLPILVTECGPDSAAHRYPRVFSEPWFALEEIETYIRIGAICQPNTIMPWQFNANYSLLAGGGIYGDDSPLHPTQRFWNMKQLGSTPPGAFWLPLTADRPNITCAAAADLSRGAYAIHVVNNGATREAFISGIPSSVKKMRVCVTNAEREMFETAHPSPVEGKIRVVLPQTSYISLFSE